MAPVNYWALFKFQNVQQNIQKLYSQKLSIDLNKLKLFYSLYLWKNMHAVCFPFYFIILVLQYKIPIKHMGICGSYMTNVWW